MSITLVDPGVIGLVSQAVGVDRWIGVAGSNGTTYIDSFYSLATNPAGGGALELEITNSDRSTIQTISFADGELAKQTTIALTINAGEQVLRRITAAPPEALNLSGYVSANAITGGGGPSPVGGDLALLADVKLLLGKDVVATNQYDQLLQLLITSVSQRMQSYCRRILTASSFSERFYPSEISSAIVLPQWPVDPDPANLVVTEDGRQLDSTNEVRLEGTRRLRRIASGYRTTWGKEVSVGWNSGHAQVPQDIQQACRAQTIHEFNKTRASGNAWQGQVSKTTNVGGSQTLVTDDWLPQVLDVLKAYRASW